MTHRSNLRQTRQPAVAGLFYPEAPEELEETVLTYLTSAPPFTEELKAAIAPHAGYIYSGQAAAHVHRAVQNLKGQIDTIVLIGPAHRYRFNGLATCDYHNFATPLGLVQLNYDLIESALELPFVRILNQAHEEEHCLEVQLPFLQCIDQGLSIVPILFGQATEDQIESLLGKLCCNGAVLPIISSDLSHYLPYQEGRKIDAATSKAIESLEPDKIVDQAACGALAIRALLKRSIALGYRVKTLCLTNSGETAGPRDRVVGYGAYAFL